MRSFLVAVFLLASWCVPAGAAVSVSIGINLQLYPNLVPVPGYPVYYAPELDSNYFFYDGYYWVYTQDGWYSSPWYDGPWDLVDPQLVPLYVLRVPVRYYRRPPVFFRGWIADAPPRWGEHWGRDWEQRRAGWDRWDHAAIVVRAPLPVYQREYSGNRYPRADQQQALRAQNYRYQSHEAPARQQAPRPPTDRQKPPQDNARAEQRTRPTPGSPDRQSRPERSREPDGRPPAGNAEQKREREPSEDRGRDH